MTNSTIKTWRERIGAGEDFPMHVPSCVERAMMNEIAELRSQADRQLKGKNAAEWYVAYCETSEKLKAAEGCIQRYKNLVGTLEQGGNQLPSTGMD